MVTEWINTEFEGEELTDTGGCIKVFSVLNDNITLENSYKTDSYLHNSITRNRID